jgi:hypothetical protein
MCDLLLLTSSPVCILKKSTDFIYVYSNFFVGIYKTTYVFPLKLTLGTHIQVICILIDPFHYILL